jgi:hypothetical protein
MAVPTRAPSRPRAPAVAPVRVRRVVLAAPVAVSVRRSLAVSLRIRPTVMAITANASSRPKAVPPSSSCDSDGCADLVSTVAPVALAICWAL